MLVLSRRIGESITIGKDIRVTVVDVQGYSVRIGVEADKSIPVERDDMINRPVSKEGSEQ